MPYKIKDNSIDSWEIVEVEQMDSDSFATFRKAKRELIDIFVATIEQEKEALSQIRKLKKKDIINFK